MNHETQVAMIRELIESIENKTVPDAGKIVSSPMVSYTDETIAEKEREALFRNHPQMIGLSGELDKPGAFRTLNDFGTPILATRDREGKFHAFLNSCRHRGAQVTAEPRGNQSRFICAYHAWTYGNDGRLLSVREAGLFGEIDKSCNGLVELPSEEKYGLLWVHPRPDGVLDVDALLGKELASELSTWELERCEYRAELNFDRPLNWKLASDTFCEGYHFSVLHQRTAANVVKGDFTTYRTFGRNHCMVVPNQNITSLRDKPESEWQLPTMSSIAYYLFPNVHIINSGNIISVTRIFPDPQDPTRSVSKISIYQADHWVSAGNPADVVQLSGENIYHADISKPIQVDLTGMLQLFTTTVDDEDYKVACQIQTSANSGLVDAIKFGRNEPGLHHVNNVIRVAIGLEPLEEYHAQAA